VLAYNLKRMMSIFGIAGLLEAIRAWTQPLGSPVRSRLGRWRGPNGITNVYVTD